MIDQMSSELHGVRIKLNTTQPTIVYNDIKKRIMLEFLTEDGQFQILLILFLVFQFDINYIFNQL